MEYRAVVEVLNDAAAAALADGFDPLRAARRSLLELRRQAGWVEEMLAD